MRVCVESGFVQQSSFFSFPGRLGGPGSPPQQYLRERASGLWGWKNYERDSKSRRRASWIMSAAGLKKRDGTICSSIWMAVLVTAKLTQAEEVWRGCEDYCRCSPLSVGICFGLKTVTPNMNHLSLWHLTKLHRGMCFPCRNTSGKLLTIHP